MKIASIGW